MSAVLNLDLSLGSSGLRSLRLHLTEKVSTISQLSKHNVLSVQPGGISSADEELGSVGVGSSVSHREASESSVLSSLSLEALISELSSVDRLSSTSISRGEVSSLAHEVGDDTVELGSLVGQTSRVVSAAQRAEVLSGLGNNVIVELKGEASSGLSTNGNVEEYFLLKQRQSRTEQKCRPSCLSLLEIKLELSVLRALTAMIQISVVKISTNLCCCCESIFAH